MPDVTITIRRNGSLKVEGPFRLIDSAGQEMPLPVDKPVISLCRCGHSQNKPFCDGAHKTCGFEGAEAHVLAAEQAAASAPKDPIVVP
ncbi:MAG TPA: CDGSH iron-sulfur domain-containing protein [Terriglobales bacterium]|nr:CDGSH iron-sulfur domain-containing protein [Terriglobales bacterium]